MVVEDDSPIGAAPTATTPASTVRAGTAAVPGMQAATAGAVASANGKTSGAAGSGAGTCAADSGGAECVCQPGFEMKEGLCLASDGGSCSDDLDCANGHCEGGTCCAQACATPDAECKTAEGATCADGKTCVYPVAADGTACDDGNACLNGSTCKAGQCQPGTQPINCDDQNDCTDDSCDMMFGCKNQNNTKTCDDKNACTSNDRCNGGVCSGASALDCSSSGDACNTGACDPATGKCAKKPLPDGSMCDDKDSCTSEDKCTAGSCKGGNACGPNATACTAGTPNRCTCKTDYVAAQGMCVPKTDECSAKPCDANATCFDPSNAANDVTCKCKPGFTGDGKTCTASESCDWGGTFAGHIVVDISWGSETAGVEAGSGTAENWYIDKHTVDANGNITAEVVLCGESGPDLCASVLGSNEAYASWYDRKYYDGMARATYHWKPFSPAPGATFETEYYALLAGIQLTDPSGPWPSDRTKVQGGPSFGGTAVNGARWVDTDGDSFVGITMYSVGPEGASSTASPGPLVDYGMRSEQCPRSNPNAPRSAYANVPAPDGVVVRRIKRIWSATRVTQAYKGKLDSCDAFSGEVVGPAEGYPQIDDVFASCIRQNGSGEAPCSDAVVDSLENTKPSGKSSATSKLEFKRVADNITCDAVRAMKF